MLQRLRHERVTSHGLVAALPTLDDSLHDSREYSIDDRRVALLKLLANILYRFAMI